MEWLNEVIFQGLLLCLLFLASLLCARHPAGQFETSVWGILTGPLGVGLMIIILLVVHGANRGSER